MNGDQPEKPRNPRSSPKSRRIKPLSRDLDASEIKDPVIADDLEMGRNTYVHRNQEVTGSRSQELENTEDDIIRRVQPSERCSLHIHSLQPEPNCRFMYDRVEDQKVLPTMHLDYMEKSLMLQWHHSEEPDKEDFLETPNRLSARPLSESFNATSTPTTTGKLSSSKELYILVGSGPHLDLQKFLGKVIGIEGHNTSGHCLVTSKVVDSLCLLCCRSVSRKNTSHGPGYQPNSEPSTSRTLSLIADILCDVGSPCGRKSVCFVVGLKRDHKYLL